MSSTNVRKAAPRVAKAAARYRPGKAPKGYADVESGSEDEEGGEEEAGEEGDIQLRGIEAGSEDEDDDEDEEGSTDSKEAESNHPQPLSKKQLDRMRAELLDGYSLPSNPPDTPTLPKGQDLSKSEQISLKHYIAWSTSRGTVRAYKLHARVLQDASGIEILSLHNIRKLASGLTGLEPTYVDICSKSCIAYVGKYAEDTTCPYKRDGKNACGESQYKLHQPGSKTEKPKARMLTPMDYGTIC